MFRRFAANADGAVLVFTGIALALLIAFTGLGIEVSGWYSTTRKMQGASDAAAISAAASYVNGEAGYQSVGYRYASLNGFCDQSQISPCDANSTSTGVTVTVNPITDSKIRVDIWDAPQPWLVQAVWKLKPYSCGNDSTDQFACLHVHSIVTVHASTSTTNNGCLLGLNRTQTALIVEGNGDIAAPTCVAVSDTCGGNSSCSLPGLKLVNNNAIINTAALYVATPNAFLPCTPGSPTTTCNIGASSGSPPSSYTCPAGTGSQVCIGLSTTTAPLWTLDPYANRTMPNPGSCPASDPLPTVSATGVITYSPGTYCHGISLQGANTVAIFQDGTYFLGATNNSTASGFSITGGVANWISVASATLANAGTNYKKNDVLTVQGGTSISPTTIKVTSVNGKTGAITGFTVTSGAFSVAPTNSASVTGGAGTGATFNLTLTDSRNNQVSFLLTGPTGADVGGAQIKNAAAHFVSPSSGATQGLVFWQDCYPKITACVPSAGGTFNGNGSGFLLIDGTVYFPHQTVLIAGNATFQPTDCTAIVADIIDFQGLGSIQKGCVPTGNTGGGGSGGSFSMTE